MVKPDKRLETMTARILAVRAEIGEAWPTGTDPKTGGWATTQKLGWTAGYWIEMLRLAGERTDDWDLYEDAAARMMRLRVLLDRHSFYNAPAFYYGAARLYESLSDRASRTAALSAAYTVRAVANPACGGLFLDPPKGKSAAAPIIVPVEAAHRGLLLDWWALQETGDTTFLDGAERMLDLLIGDFIDERGNVADAMSYDRQSGTLLGKPRRRGGSHAASLARALCGLLRGWEVTREERFLEAAKLVLGTWIDLNARLRSAGKGQSLPTAMVCEALARLAVMDPQPDEAKAFSDHLQATLDRSIQRLLPAFTGNSESREPIAALYHLYAALHCLDVGGMPC